MYVYIYIYMYMYIYVLHVSNHINILMYINNNNNNISSCQPEPWARSEATIASIRSTRESSVEHDAHMARFQSGSFPIGFFSNWARFELGSIIIAFLPNDLPNWKRQAVRQHLDDHVGAESETSRVLGAKYGQFK